MLARRTFMPQPFRSFFFLLGGSGDAFFYAFEPGHGYLLFVIGYWLLVIGYWLLVTGYWLLVTGYWLLVTTPMIETN